MTIRRVTPRAALVAALGVAWLNFVFTARWAYLPGSLNGWKRPWYAVALLLATVLAVRSRPMGMPVNLPRLPLLIAGGWILLATAYLCAFPPATWQLIPFFDDWPPRYQSTVEGLQLLAHGALAGWQWNLLGGYQTSADLTQSLTLIAGIPMALFGDRLGFHMAHALLVAAIPLLVYADVAAEAPQDEARLTLVFALVGSTGFFGTIMPSGDTNSIAGVFAAMTALIGSSFARRGRRWGAPLLVLGLTLALYSHLAFFLYANVLLGLEAVFYRDGRMLVRHGVALSTAILAGLPQYWELLRYPAYFKTNNVLYGPVTVEWIGLARRLFYNAEMLVHPHRWFNDYLSLVYVFLAVFVWAVTRAGRTRARFYAWAALAVVAMVRLDVIEFGFLFSRQMHLMAALAAPPLAWFIVQQSGGRPLAWALIAVVALYVQSQFAPIRHVDHVREFDPALVDRVGSLDGHLVLVEGNPHRDLIADPDRRTERTPFGTHFESMLAAATSRGLYGQTWDSWHWTPFRGQQVAGGSFRGRPIEVTPIEAFESEMRKWGVRHLLVWSRATVAYLNAAPGRFNRRWTSGRWVHYEMRDADTRPIVMPVGTGTLQNLDLLSGEVALAGVRQGDLVVVRMNYFPAWTASAGGADVPLMSHHGQLAFRAPADGSYIVRLTYPPRTLLVLLALVSLGLGSVLLVVMTPREHGGGGGHGTGTTRRHEGTERIRPLRGQISAPMDGSAPRCNRKNAAASAATPAAAST